MATSNRNHYSQKHSKYAYRSGLENTNAEHIKQALKAPVKYEAFQIIYTIPSRQTRYTPDFVLPNGIIIETKGRFMPADRQKHLLIKAQYPDLDLRFVFTNSRNSSTRVLKLLMLSGVQSLALSMPISMFQIHGLKKPHAVSAWKPTSFI